MLRLISILFISIIFNKISYANSAKGSNLVSSYTTSQIVINTSGLNKNAVIDSYNFNTKIAIVDIESVFEHSIAIKDIKNKINKLSDEIQQEMSKVEIELKEAEALLIRQRNNISEEEFDTKTIEFNTKVSQAQKLLQSRKIYLEKARTDGIAVVHKTIQNIITDLSAKHGFNLVLPTTQIIFATDNLNITLEVITNLNKTLTDIDISYDSNNM